MPILDKLADPAFLAPFDIVIATDLPWQAITTLNAATQLAQCKFYAAGMYGSCGYIFADLLSHNFVLEREKPNARTRIGLETPSRSIVDVQTKRGENGKILEMVTKTERYCHIMLANTSTLPDSILRDDRKKKKVTPLLACLRALWELEGTANWDSESDAGVEAFQRLAREKQAELQLPAAALTEDIMDSFLSDIGETTPSVSAFLGGLAAQDVINVLGQKQQPIQNFLVFDAQGMTAPIYAMHPRPVDFMANGVNGTAPNPVVVPINGSIVID